ncbi:hypothetical protein BC629DRAFT_1517302 [Irpex lacteus]|nr:hypothetical protein BC629DRAFT_1517302 [Irpex lacteus]
MDSSTVLNAIVGRAQRNLALLQTRPPPSSSAPTRLSLTLPDPAPLVSRLVHSGLKNTAAQRLSTAYMHHATHLKLHYERVMNNAINACVEASASSATDMEKDVTSFHAAYTATYQHALAQCAEAIIQRSRARVSHLVSSLQSDDSSSYLSEKPRPFKQELLVTLEHAFSDNPYPTRLEKIKLANHVGISFKQVDVWFQNRRSRFKREGKDIQRISFVIENGGVSQVKCADTKVIHNPSSMSTQISMGGTLGAQSNPGRRTPCPFHIDYAPHAFPNPFPPACDYKPFPILDGPQTFDTPWPRHAGTDQRKNQVNDALTDVEQLCLPLSRLNLKDSQSSSEVVPPRSRTRRLRDHIAPCFPSLIRPPSAPLPALLPVTVTVHTSDYTHDSLASSSSSSLSRHIVYASRSLGASTRQTSARKSVDTLPLRNASSSLKTTKDWAHPYPSRKSSRPKAQEAKLSRLSSMSSLSLFCLSGIPPPITPPQLSVELPRSRKVSSPDLIFSPSQDLDHLFSDSDVPALSFLNNRQPRIVQ